jgi:hypothetical protein
VRQNRETCRRNCCRENEKKARRIAFGSSDLGRCPAGPNEDLLETAKGRGELTFSVRDLLSDSPVPGDTVGVLQIRDDK